MHRLGKVHLGPLGIFWSGANPGGDQFYWHPATRVEILTARVPVDPGGFTCKIQVSLFKTFFCDFPILLVMDLAEPIGISSPMLGT